jgi:hypothetical protein
MPFVSESQRRYLWQHRPDIAQRWSKEYGSGKDLPYHVRKRKRIRKRVGKKRS